MIQILSILVPIEKVQFPIANDDGMARKKLEQTIESGAKINLNSYNTVEICYRRLYLHSIVNLDYS